MYIDVSLVNMFEKRYGKKYDIEKAIEECGIWCTADEIRFVEWEEFDAPLEEIMSEYYFIVMGNKIFFCSPEQFIKDCDEWT